MKLTDAALVKIVPIVEEIGATDPQELADMIAEESAAEAKAFISAITKALPFAKQKTFTRELNKFTGTRAGPGDPPAYEKNLEAKKEKVDARVVAVTTPVETGGVTPVEEGFPGFDGAAQVTVTTPVEASTVEMEAERAAAAGAVEEARKEEAAAAARAEAEQKRNTAEAAAALEAEQAAVALAAEEAQNEAAAATNAKSTTNPATSFNIGGPLAFLDL
eukprot:gene30154-5593_t